MRARASATVPLLLTLCCSNTMMASADIRITRLAADANFLFPTNARKLTRFMMEASYGPCRPMTAAWAQRGVLDSAADSDFFARLSYFEQDSERGAIFTAESEDGELCGFADLSASL